MITTHSLPRELCTYFKSMFIVQDKVKQPEKWDGKPQVTNWFCEIICIPHRVEFLVTDPFIQEALYIFQNTIKDFESRYLTISNLQVILKGNFPGDILQFPSFGIKMQITGRAFVVQRIGHKPARKRYSLYRKGRKIWVDARTKQRIPEELAS